MFRKEGEPRLPPNPLFAKEEEQKTLSLCEEEGGGGVESHLMPDKKSAPDFAEGNLALTDMVGKRVEVWTNSGDDEHSDRGTLEAFAFPFVRINDNGKILCFSIFNIRLIKLIERQSAASFLSQTLLRPALPVGRDAQDEDN